MWRKPTLAPSICHRGDALVADKFVTSNIIRSLVLIPVLALHSFPSTKISFIFPVFERYTMCRLTHSNFPLPSEHIDIVSRKRLVLQIYFVKLFTSGDRRRPINHEVERRLLAPHQNRRWRTRFGFFLLEFIRPNELFSMLIKLTQINHLSPTL